MSSIEPFAPSTALDPRVRFLPPITPSGYRVGDTESLAAALHRLTTDQFTIAIDHLADPGEDVAAATIAARTAMQRIISVLALVRTVIGDEAYRTEVTILDDTANRLEALLAGSGAIAAIDRIRGRFESVLRPTAFAETTRSLEQRHLMARVHAMSASETIDTTLHSLRRARARFAAWPIEGDVARMYGREPIPDEFSSVEPGLREAYKAARRHWLELQDDNRLPDLDEWGRHTRQLGHQLSLLATVWPEVIGATAGSCLHLADVIAEASEYAELSDAVSDDPSLCADDVERILLDALITSAFDELRRIASVLGARLFVESTKQFIARLTAYWASRDLVR